MGGRYTPDLSDIPSIGIKAKGNVVSQNRSGNEASMQRGRKLRRRIKRAAKCRSGWFYIIRWMPSSHLGLKDFKSVSQNSQ
ncbi:unnamed protein product [Pieris macdunnoughi]|uniref:Uncharacterized protein n=1 Tax=Pieris macdunnoughi TaxID=345717 RepID=A0A821TXB6_9NEOP|nr:unnamed protein product [Pieris macdunnoughi]